MIVYTKQPSVNYRIYRKKRSFLINLPNMKINTADDLLVKSVMFVIVFEVSLCVVKGNNGITRSFTFTEVSKKSYSHEVLEGDTIDLICQQHTTDECQIWGDNIEYVNNGSLSQSLPDNIIFNRNFSACILTIINVSRDNQDDFICRNRGFKYLNVEVIYSPPEEYPRCTSNYELPIVFSDQLQVPFEFNCTTEEGNPAVHISLYVETDGRQKQVNSTDLIIPERQLSKSRSFSTYLDSSFNNSNLICRVIQQLPAPYESYNKSCHFGPLTLLSTFSVSINSSHYKVNTNKREHITLTCTSNVSEVELEWTDIPLEDWQYNITKINDSLQLKIFDCGSSADGSITINCSGSYGGRTVFEDITIDSIVKGCLGTPISCNTLQYLILVIIVTVVSVVIIIVYRNSKRRQRKEWTPTAEPTNSRTQNNNNTNDLGLSSSTADEGNSLNPMIAGSSQEDTEMVDNPIYGSKSDESPTQINTQVDSVSYKSISITDMTDNLLYEACNPRVTVLQDDNDDNYAIVSI